MLERNFVKFLARTPGDTFRALWSQNVLRLKALKKLEALEVAAHTPARHDKPCGQHLNYFAELIPRFAADGRHAARGAFATGAVR